MIIPRHKVCDICEAEVGVNLPFVTIREECIWAGCAGSIKRNRKLHICYDCWERITKKIAEELE